MVDGQISLTVGRTKDPAERNDNVCERRKGDRMKSVESVCHIQIKSGEHTDRISSSFPGSCPPN